MPALPNSVLHAKLAAALPAATTFSDSQLIHPALAAVPGIGPVRIYLWTVTHVESEDRPQDEYKIQLILPGQGRSQRGRLDLADRPTFLLGYSPDFGVFVGWEATMHEHFSFSAAVQVKEATLEEARITGWAVAPPRRVGGGSEVRVAFSPGNLTHYLACVVEANRLNKTGIAREAFLLLKTPNAPRITVPPRGADVPETIEAIRREQLFRRKTRDARFGPLVKQQFDYACAVCGIQLELIEGAHIIPVSVARSRDEVWNGLALCRNHHKLFDAFAFVVTPSLTINIDQPTVDYYRESGRGEGLKKTLTMFDGRQLRSPEFFARDRVARNRMLEALEWREHLAAL